MEIEITNTQSFKRINLKSLRRQLEKALELLSLSSRRVSVLLCDNKTIRKINKRYLGKPTSTDVIAFSLKDDLEPGYLGEVVVSVEEAVKASKRFSQSWQKELLLYLIHGILHLLDYDDTTLKKRKMMEAKQTKILQKVFPDR